MVARSCGSEWRFFSSTPLLDFCTMPLSAYPHRNRESQMPKPSTLSAVVLSFVLACQIPSVAQSTADPDINKKIRQEETDHSQIMHTMHFLTDVYGPRLTGSPN